MMFRALLIGVDFYFPNKLPSGASYQSLHGCVADVGRVEATLRARVDPAPEIVKLVAAHDAHDRSRPAGERATWPTHANITAALERLVAASAPGDQVFIHYSGHGGRARTIYPDLKGAAQYDESLVPCDIGRDDGDPGVVADRYVRDVHLARFLHALAQRGAVVTLVFDSCHSGGATRDAASGTVPRTATGGTSPHDTSDGAIDPDVLAAQVRASWQALAAEAAARRLALGATRDAGGASWVPDAGRYVFLAACLETESALETTLDDGTRGGVLTDALVRALGTPDTTQPWQTVFARVTNRVRARHPQTPMLFGDAGREALGVRLRAVPEAVTVTKVDVGARRVALDAGLATGLTNGARFEVHAVGTTDFSRSDSRLATVVVTEAGAAESWARVEGEDPADRVVVGAPAVQLSAPLRHRVAWSPRPGAASDAAARDALRRAIADGGAGFLALSEDGAAPAFLVGLDDDERYQIFDDARAPLPNLPPAIAPDGNGAAQLVERLLHLARYRTLLALEQTQSALRKSVRVELLLARDDDAEDGAGIPRIGGLHVLDDGARVLVRVTNHGGRPVRVAALDFTSRWKVDVVVPASDDARNEVVGAGELKAFALRMSVPEGFEEVPDVLKVFVTLGDVDCRRMRLPMLGHGLRSDATRGAAPAASALDRALAMLDADLNTRDAAPISEPGAEWTVWSFDLLTTRRPVAATEAPTPPASRSLPQTDEPRGADSSRPLTPDELRELARTQRDGGAAVLGAMMPRGTDLAPILQEVKGDVPTAVARGVWPFVGSTVVDGAELAAFNKLFGQGLAAPVTATEAGDVRFQTDEDWHGYATTGGLAFVSGCAVRRPMKLDLARPPVDMTFGLRPDQDPRSAPLRMGLFADFGNGLYAPREIARQLVARRYPYAFHLGDVYYDGKEDEFRRYFAEPLGPLVADTELFMLAGNHEMYSKGEHFQRYIKGKALQHVGLQRQNAEMFRLRGAGVQIIGLDTMWCDWEGKPFRGNEPRLDAATRALLEVWLTEGDPDGLNILLTSNEPWSTESRDTTKILDDLEPFIRRGLVDVWFWGNVHHAAVYDGWQFDGAVEHGFVSACVGHGGYPFYTQGEPKTPLGVRCRWSERRHRFWPFNNVRPDVGLNGWCELAVARKAGLWDVTLTFRDWLGRDRARARVVKPLGMGPRLTSVDENLSAEPGGADWQTR